MPLQGKPKTAAFVAFLAVGALGGAVARGRPELHGVALAAQIVATIPAYQAAKQ